MVKIQKLDKKDRPREKLITKGAKSLSETELLQVIIGSGVKGADVTKISRNIKKLIDTNGYKIIIDQLTSIKGVSTATATKLVALFELAEREFKDFTVIDSAEKASALVPELKDAKQEHLIVLSLDGAHRLIQKRLISIGTLNASLVHPREVFADPITDRAASIIVIHNHPSGTLQPSDADTQITNRLKESGKLLGIKLLDHVIITHKGHFSFAEEGIL
ncbi:DNA repair protein RadC [Candidatus Saccharibacteria bacterium]|nr:DNA repair protein RadC [Candidatus Saccharibacteria bacterium]MCB9817449.1 DNA repair protein RadC [Candidatus Nomurabacteria bacterium]